MGDRPDGDPAGRTGPARISEELRTVPLLACGRLSSSERRFRLRRCVALRTSRNSSRTSKRGPPVLQVHQPRQKVSH
jgi:hypothetical protein